MNFAITKILIIFAVVLVLNRIKVNLGVSLIIGAIGLNLWAGLGVPGTLVNLGHALMNSELWFFVLVMALIIEVDHYMTEESNSAEIVAATKRWGGRHGRAFTIMAMPAVMGLIPSPAGALFSAPFVEQASGKDEGSAAEPRPSGPEASPEWKATVNYWFRHIWEYWWPLYPGVIIAMSLFNMIPSWQFVSVQVLFTLVTILAGYFLFVRSHIPRLAGIPGGGEGSSRRALFLLTPLVIVLLSLFVLPYPLSKILPGMHVQARKLFAVVIGLVAALFLIAWDNQAQRHPCFAKRLRRAGKGTHASLGGYAGQAEAESRNGIENDNKGTESSNPQSAICNLQSGAGGRKMFATLFTKTSMSVQLSLVGVMVFQFMLEKSGLLPMAGRELLGSGIPLVFAIVTLPFLAGMVTGIGSGFTGTAFPLVVGLMVTQGSGLTPIATLVLAYGFGYMGVLLSPVHLCLLVTKDYFKTSLSRFYRQLIPAVVVVLVYSTAAHVVFRFLGW